MSEKFVGKWSLESSENFDDFMKEVGVNFLTRKAAGCVKPVLEFEVSNAGEHWKMTSTSTFTTWNCEFDLNKEFEVKTADGRTVKTIFAYENGKLTEKQSKLKDDEKDSYYERYIDESGKLVIVHDGSRLGEGQARVHEGGLRSEEDGRRSPKTTDASDPISSFLRPFDPQFLISIF
ncbi:hypothetical protein niasHT_036721 [Heterodera trifolii]|uniref:Cytosolic fatty-acid binding proteins domain-containing protein n=1 Tax=Heterodera trifolii TaxID=157864 RepID=A0ABD2IQC5_9BILA